MIDFLPNLIISFFSGALGSGLTFLATRKKYKLEVQQLERNLGISNKNIAINNERIEINDKRIELIEYEVVKEVETIIYDGRDRDIEGDFTVKPWKAWSNEKQGFLDEMGEGSHVFLEGMIDINRTNTGGRYSMSLKRYNYGNQVNLIPIDKTIDGKRKLKISCQAKSINADHTLSFIIKSEDNTTNLDLKEYRVFSRNWETVELAFAIRTDVTSYLRIDDFNVSKSPSSIQITNIVLYEKK